MSSSSNPDSNLPLNTLLHMLAIKLTSSNYLLLKNQTVPILSYQNLLGHVDGSSSAPSPTVVQNKKMPDNPLHAPWLAANQRTVIILHASLSEEAVTVIVGVTTARQIWVALEEDYSNSSIERVQNLHKQLRQTLKCNKTIAEYGRNFKLLCDQLSAIGKKVEDAELLHWFLYGLRSSFETFSTTILSTRPASSLPELLAKAESHELFMRALHDSTAPTVAFSAQSSWQSSNYRGHGVRFTRGSESSGGRLVVADQSIDNYVAPTVITPMCV